MMCLPHTLVLMEEQVICIYVPAIIYMYVPASYIYSACAAVVNMRDYEIYRAAIIYKNAHRPGLIMPNNKLLFMCKA